MPRGADRELRELLNEWDPIGVYHPLEGCPPDEHDCLQAPLMRRLRRGASAEEISSLLDFELRGHFGIEPEQGRTQDFAEQLVRWFVQRPG